MFVHCFHPGNYLNRLTLAIGIMFGICPAAVVELTLDPFRYDSLEKRKCIIGKVGPRMGAS